MRDKYYPKKCRGSSLFSYGFASIQTCSWTVEAAAIGKFQRKLRLNMRLARVTQSSICSLVAEACPYPPSYFFVFSVVIALCLSAVSHETFSGGALVKLQKIGKSYEVARLKETHLPMFQNRESENHRVDRSEGQQVEKPKNQKAEKSRSQKATSTRSKNSRSFKKLKKLESRKIRK